ncbi:MAG TPA: M23 family metallopeptidase [Solirubrobacteraceae bacterium]|nr:M23 family metallopeptidase [Solirubrobacteraceae bacterium]
MLLPPLLAGLAVLCLLLAVAMSFGQRPHAGNPLTGAAGDPDRLARQLTIDLEGTPTPADIRRARRPLSERQRILRAHPYFSLYRIARRRFGVPWYLIAAVHYQETGFGEAPAKLAEHAAWRRHRDAIRGIPRPPRYPNRSRRHPSVKDDFDVVMTLAAELRAGGARGLGGRARRALSARYGAGSDGRLASAMVLERARTWRLLGTLPLPGRGELATPVEGVVGGCGYFGCPRPGHLHNGVDFLAPSGTPIRAAEGGRIAVVESSARSGGYGNFVCIQHRLHLASCYAHLSAFAASVRPGANVRRGEVIGRVGSTGSSSAPHLHFEVRRGDAACSACAVDPLPLLSGEVPTARLPAMAAVPPAVAPAATERPPVAAPARAPAPAPAPNAPTPAADDRAVPPPADREAPMPGGRRGRAKTDGEGGGTPSKDTPASRRKPAPVPAAQPAPPPRPPVAPAPSPPASEPGTGDASPVVPSAPAPPPPNPPPASDRPAQPPVPPPG